MKRFIVAAALVLAVGVGGLAAAPPAQAHHMPGPCDIHWWKAWHERHDVGPIKEIIRCAVAHWAVPGGPAFALAVAACESGFRPDAYGGGNAGVYQHRIPYWEGRYDTYTRPRWQLWPSVYNGRTNVIVSIRWVHAMWSWSPWAAGACA
jgi:hypothetical protein